MFSLISIFYRSLLSELRFIRKSRFELSMLFILPFVSIFLIWTIFTNSQIRQVPIGVFDFDNTELSRKLIMISDSSPSVKIAKKEQNITALESYFQKREIYGALIIEKGFAKDIQSLKQTGVKIIVNSQFSTHSSVIESALTQAVRNLSYGIKIKILQKNGYLEKQALDHIMPIIPNIRIAFNQSLNYQKYLATVLIPSLLHILITVIGASSCGRHFSENSLDTWLFSLGKRNLNFFERLFALLGKLTPAMIVFSIWGGLTLLFVAIDDLPPLNSLLITFGSYWIFVLISLWLGSIFAILTMSKRIAFSFAGLLTVPAFSYSGITYPIFSMPDLAQIISKIMPLTYYLQIQRSQMQMHQDFHNALPNLYILMVITLIMALVATASVRFALNHKEKWEVK